MITCQFLPLQPKRCASKTYSEWGGGATSNGVLIKDNMVYLPNNDGVLIKNNMVCLPKVIYFITPHDLCVFSTTRMLAFGTYVKRPPWILRANMAALKRLNFYYENIQHYYVIM